MISSAAARAIFARAAMVTGSCCVALAACGEELHTDVMGEVQPLINGADDRQEYFEAADSDAALRLSESMAVLIPRAQLESSMPRLADSTPTRGEHGNLCPEVPFRDQPAAAFCTAVLVDWDLVLTAGHCVRVLAPGDLAVVFGFYYREQGVLDWTSQDIFFATEIVSEALEPIGSTPRLDFAWLRLDRPAAPPRRPAPVRLDGDALARGDSLVSMGSADGVPLKLDPGAKVIDAREARRDYFVASTDSSHGWSGGGAFDHEGSLWGILARGGDDFLPDERGCYTEVQQPDDHASEEYTYAQPSVEALCAVADEPKPSLCRPDCGVPCRALPLAVAAAGCSATGDSQPPHGDSTLYLALALVLVMQLKARWYHGSPRVSVPISCRASGVPWRGRAPCRANTAAGDEYPARGRSACARQDAWQ
jgi:hypothetical protein